MKISLDLNDALLNEAKAFAAQQRTSLSRVVEEGLRLRLRSRTPKPESARIPVYQGEGGLVAGLDAGSNRAVLDAADSDA